MNKYAITAHLREVCQEGTVLGVIKKNKVDMKANTALSTAAPRGCCRNPPSSWTKSSECLPTSLPQQSVVWKRFEEALEKRFLWKEKKAPKTENGNRRKSETRTIFASFTLWSTMSYTASLRAFLTFTLDLRFSFLFATCLTFGIHFHPDTKCCDALGGRTRNDEVPAPASVGSWILGPAAEEQMKQMHFRSLKMATTRINPPGLNCFSRLQTTWNIHSYIIIHYHTLSYIIHIHDP